MKQGQDAAHQTVLSDKLGIRGQVQTTNDHHRHPFRFGRLDLAVNRGILDRSGVGRHLGLGPGHSLGVDQHVRLRGIQCWRNCNVERTEKNAESHGKGNDTPLTGDEIANIKQSRLRTRPVADRLREELIVKLVGKVHRRFSIFRRSSSAWLERDLACRTHWIGRGIADRARCAAIPGAGTGDGKDARREAGRGATTPAEGRAAPPAPGKVLVAGEKLGLVTTTLPEEPVAADSAAAVAAVERSPTTAANRAWNWPSGKAATDCWICSAACWSTFMQASAAWARPAAIAALNRGRVSLAI